MDHPSRKLGYQQEGLYKILEQIGNAYRLDLPTTNMVHPVFAPEQLHKAADNLLPGQQNEPLLPVQYNGEDEWEVEEILAIRCTCNRLYYCVKWTNLDHDPVWYDPEGFKGAPRKLKAFHNQYPNKPGLPQHLTDWIHCYEEGTDPEDHWDDNLLVVTDDKDGIWVKA